MLRFLCDEDCIVSRSFTKSVEQSRRRVKMISEAAGEVKLIRGVDETMKKKDTYQMLRQTIKVIAVLVKSKTF